MGITRTSFEIRDEDIYTIKLGKDIESLVRGMISIHNVEESWT